MGCCNWSESSAVSQVRLAAGVPAGAEAATTRCAILRTTEPGLMRALVSTGLVSLPGMAAPLASSSPPSTSCARRVGLVVRDWIDTGDDVLELATPYRRCCRPRCSTVRWLPSKLRQRVDAGSVPSYESSRDRARNQPAAPAAPAPEPWRHALKRWRFAGEAQGLGRSVLCSFVVPKGRSSGPRVTRWHRLSPPLPQSGAPMLRCTAVSSRSTWVCRADGRNKHAQG